MELDLPKSQNAEQTRGSAPLKVAASRALYMAQEDAGDPGRGNMLPFLMGETLLGKAAHLLGDGCWIHWARAINRHT